MTLVELCEAAMLKQISKQEVCASCGIIKHGVTYEVYCDNCGKLMEKGGTYGSKLNYVVWDNGIDDFDDRHKEKNFCSYECLFDKMRKERLSKNKYISITLYLDKKERDKLLLLL